MRTTLTSAVRRFLDTEAAGGIVLVIAALVALAWANVAPASYSSTFGGDVHRVVNDGLMALFFLVVGLEIKRELVTGDLRDPRVAALPALGALGGMVVPALLYVAIAGDAGWGIPMATDIAFAVGVLALLGDRVPSAAKLFLLSLAIVDDIGAIAVIALVYSDGVDPLLLAAAVAAVAVAWSLRRVGVHALAVHVALGMACWLAMYESGVHATIAGVAFGLITPADRTERAERLLHPVSSFLIVPLFALVNAGVQIDVGALDGAGATAAGVLAGLVVGKPLGIVAAAWLGVRLRLVTLPAGVSWPTLVGVGAVAGIGFTVSLFVSELAFDDAGSVDAAKLAVLAASVVASIVGGLVTWRATT